MTQGRPRVETSEASS